MDMTSVQCCDWTPVIGSSFEAKTSGGALLIQMTVALQGGSSDPDVTCAPFLNGKWAGEFGGLPALGAPTAVSYREGLINVIHSAWTQWRGTRVYPGIPADTYNVEVRCAANTNWVTVNGPAMVASYASVIELK
jgi:hypothetical protein